MKRKLYKGQQMQPNKTIEHFKTWIKSTEGQKNINESLTKAKEISIKLQELRKVAPELLQEPFTV